MKHLFYSIALMALLVSCSENKYQKLMTDYVETHQGTKYDLKVKYTKFELSDIKVQDSIDILNKKYEAEKAKRIGNIKSIIEIEEEYIRNREKETYFDPNNSFYKRSQERLKQQQQSLENVKQWKADYLNQYDNRNPKDALAKKADIKFSYDHPLFKTRAEESGVAIMNLEGTKLIKYISNK